jgi:hypothetical protein
MQENSELHMPEIEEDIALPASATEAFPELSPQEELNMRARTIKMLSDLKGEPLALDGSKKDEAEEIARQMISNPSLRPEFAKYPNETIAYLAGMVQQMNCMIVNELSDLKLYVVNKLVFEAENARDSKSRLTALKQLGEVDGVDAFKRRSELTVQVKPLAEVEKELLGVLSNIEAIDAEYMVVPNSPEEPHHLPHPVEVECEPEDGSEERESEEQGEDTDSDPSEVHSGSPE